MCFKTKPDKYKTIKCQVINILNADNIYLTKDVLQTINNAVISTNRIIIKSYMLLRLYILKKYESDSNDIPVITEDSIKMSFGAVCYNASRKGPTGSNLTILNELKDIYKLNISEIFEDKLKLSSVLGYYATTILTSINNNIKNNYINYINRFVNTYIKHKYENELENKDTKKALYSDITILKRDIIENTQKCNVKYHEWLNANRHKIVPIHISKTNNIYNLLNDSPQLFYKYMIYMNIELNNIGQKQFQFFPLQHNIILRHIQIDTKGLIELFESDVSKKFKDISNIKKNLWEKIFNIKQKIKDYTFDYTIITDGFSASLRFINNTDIVSEQLKKQKMKDGRNITFNKLKNMDIEHKLIENELNKKKRNTKPINNILEVSSIPVQLNNILEVSSTPAQLNNILEVFGSSAQLNNILELSSSSAQLNNILEVSDVPQTQITHSKLEFPYIDEVNKLSLGNKHIFIDPGKRSLFTMVDDDDNFLKYTNGEYMSRTKRLRYQKHINKYKKSKGVTIIEHELTSFNSKSCSSSVFITYIQKKLEINNKLIESYNDTKYRQYKWYSFINKKRAEDIMLNKIENKYSKDHVIIIGDWSIGKQMSNFISTPNLTLKRKLRERFKVFNIDEYRTSCLHNNTEERCGHLKLPVYNKKQKNIKTQNMHSILTYKMENNRLGCIDRDKNGCLNIKKIFNSYITTGDIPIRYKRGYILPNTTPTNIVEVSNGVLPIREVIDSMFI